MSQMPPHAPPPYPPASGELPLPAPGIAIASMVVGILALLTCPMLLFGIVAIVLGLIAVGKTGAGTGRQGRGFAIAGVVTGASSLLLGVVVAFFMLAPAMSNTQTTARKMQNSTQLRGIHQGMFTFANSNKENFPGLNGKGNLLEDTPDNTGLSGHGGTTEARMWILLRGQFVPPEYAINPGETSDVTEYDPWTDPTQRPVEFEAGPSVGTRHYSYAFLAIHNAPNVPDANTPPRWGGRASEWSQASNTQAIVAGDRNTGRSGPANYNAVFADKPGTWEGSVLWNDNHVSFEHTPVLETRYDRGELNLARDTMPADDIFVLDDPNDDTANGNDHNAYLVCDGASGAFSDDP